MPQITRSACINNDSVGWENVLAVPPLGGNSTVFPVGQMYGSTQSVGNGSNWFLSLFVLEGELSVDVSNVLFLKCTTRHWRRYPFSRGLGE